MMYKKKTPKINKKQHKAMITSYFALVHLK